MPERGLVRSRLERLQDGLRRHVEEGNVPGLVALVSRSDEIHLDALGTLRFGDSAPMERDTIFRIASLTKLVTATAADLHRLPDARVRRARLSLRDDRVDQRLHGGPAQLAGTRRARYARAVEEDRVGQILEVE